MTHTLSTLQALYARGAFLIILFALVLLFPTTGVQAASDSKVSGWIPYWQDEEGIESADEYIDSLDTINPFVFEVQADGSIIDRADLDERQWQRLFRTAERRDVEVIPTVSWFDGAAIHAVLSSDDAREDHIEAIIDLVEDGDFAGIEIDYESKLAVTKDYFSEFLEELKDELDQKTLVCTVEPRTPVTSRFRVVPDDIEYANDFTAINRHCDRIVLMAYDQQRIDWQLNESKSGEPYIPVADPDWVRKVVALAVEDMDADKIMLGVPTYGREWELTVAPNWFKAYDRWNSPNIDAATERADEYDVTPGRNQAGEMSFTYFPKDSIFSVLSALPAPAGTRDGNEAAAKALLFANATGMEVKVNVIWYSDARAIEDKVEIVDDYGLRGVALFKVDGEEDADIWDLF